MLAELREKGLSNEALASRLQGFCGHPIICDSAEPKSIAELRRRGIAAIPARKGPDSLRHGLRFLQGMEIIVDQSCVNVMEELESYRWRKGADGSSLPIPCGEDHLLGRCVMRYALEGDSLLHMAAAVEV